MFVYRKKFDVFILFYFLTLSLFTILFYTNYLFNGIHLGKLFLSKKDVDFYLIFSFLIIFLIWGIVIKLVLDKRRDDYLKELTCKKDDLEDINKKLIKSNQELKFLLYVDPLTNLYNRKALERDIENFKNPKLMVLDIDFFSDINQYYGQDIGDFILKEVSRILKEFANKEGMMLYRIGADEFALLEDRLLDVNRYEELSLNLINRFKTNLLKIEPLNIEIDVNITLGVSLDDEETLNKAISALNEAKRKQIDYLCYFKQIDKKDRYIEQVKWLDFIKKAIEDNRVKPFYQPIFDANKRVLKYECLVRIIDEDGNPVSPSSFLDIAKKVKKYTDIEKLLIEKSFEKIADNKKVISINLLARDMSDSNVSNFVIEQLNKYKVAKRVVFEILEDESIENLDRITTFINRVRRMGSKIAVDDFGSGYSNFSYLIKLQPDYIKIDGSLIKDIDKNRNSLAMVSSIIAFARKLGIKTIAEYVHNRAIFEICLDLGIDEFQGYYLAEPTPEI